MDVDQALGLYAAGWFPMDDQPDEPQLPWYAVEERTILDVSEEGRAALRRRVRRSLKPCADLVLAVDVHFAEVLDRCATPPEGDGIWITPRLKALYRDLHAAGFAHSFELVDRETDELAAGILGVVLGRAAMLESMRRVRDHAGNALLSRCLDFLASRGIELVDIQLPTDHTLRLGAQLIPRAEYEARLAYALRVPEAAD